MIRRRINDGRTDIKLAIPAEAAFWAILVALGIVNDDTTRFIVVWDAVLWEGCRRLSVRTSRSSSGTSGEVASPGYDTRVLQCRAVGLTLHIGFLKLSMSRRYGDIAEIQVITASGCRILVLGKNEISQRCDCGTRAYDRVRPGQIGHRR